MMEHALTHSLASKYLIISHRWEDKEDPDDEGYQAELICKYLNEDEGKSFAWVWMGACPEQ